MIADQKAGEKSNRTKVAQADVKTISVDENVALEIYWTGDLRLIQKKVRGNPKRRCLLYDTCGLPIILIPAERKELFLKIIDLEEFVLCIDDLEIALSQTELDKGKYLSAKLTAGQANRLARMGNDRQARKVIPV